MCRLLPGALAAGPGIRYAELAAVLRAAGHEVTLAAPEPGADAVWSAESVGRLAAGHEAVVLGQGHADLGRAVARSLPHDLPVVVDCYAPGIVEAIALNEDPGMFPGFLERTVELLERGDLFLVANPPQRLYTLGLLSAAGRLNPTTYADPPLLEVPFGVPSDPPQRPAARIGRGVLVPEDAALVLWYGGVYPWFDCATAVRGFARALQEVPDAWFVIVGGRHPRAHAPDAQLLEALAAARDLGIAERVVEAPWGPYDERVAWYAEADCAICLHHPGLETSSRIARDSSTCCGVASRSSPRPATWWATAPPRPVPASACRRATRRPRGRRWSRCSAAPSAATPAAARQRSSQPSSPGRTCSSPSCAGSSVHTWRPTVFDSVLERRRRGA